MSWPFLGVIVYKTILKTLALFSPNSAAKPSHDGGTSFGARGISEKHGRRGMAWQGLVQRSDGLIYWGGVDREIP